MHYTLVFYTLVLVLPASDMHLHPLVIIYDDRGTCKHLYKLQGISWLCLFTDLFCKLMGNARAYQVGVSLIEQLWGKECLGIIKCMHVWLKPIKEPSRLFKMVYVGSDKTYLYLAIFTTWKIINTCRSFLITYGI